MSANELEMKIRELRQLQQLIEEAQAEAEGIRDVIKAHMGDTEELRAGEYKITWKPVTSSRLDAVALRAALPEVHQHRPPLLRGMRKAPISQPTKARGYRSL